MTSLAASLPFFTIPVLDIGIPIQPFGILVATGVLVGAHLLRKYAEARGLDEEDIRGITAWVVVGGFIGAHVFDVLMYQADKLGDDPLLIVKLWAGISSYGGFIGGFIGFMLFTWKHKLERGVWFDTIGVGLLPGFTLGRIGCSIVHDHMGRTTDFFLGVDYPLAEIKARHLLGAYPDAGAITRIHNLGFYELLYLIPVNILVLTLAWRSRKVPAGFLAVLITMLYAPVRFFFEFLRLNETDPRYAGLTFAQWMSLIAFAGCAYVAVTLYKRGKPAPLAEELGKGVIGGRRGGPVTPAADKDKAPASKRKPGSAKSR